MPDRKRAARLRADVSQARKHAKDAIARLAELMKADDARISLAAATALLDRAFGKPAPPPEPGQDEPGRGYDTVKRVIIDRAANQDG